MLSPRQNRKRLQTERNIYDPIGQLPAEIANQLLASLFRPESQMWEALGSSFELLIYYLVCFLFRLATSIFFREVVKRGSHQVPRTGPVIFVAAPHANQFVDPLVVMQTCPRPVRFLMAAASMRKGIPGFFGRLLGCIPVERAMDLAKPGIGMIYCSPKACQDQELEIHGIGTQFTTQFHRDKTSLAVIVAPETYTAVVAEVKSDTLLVLRKPLEGPAYDYLSRKNGCPFKVLPVIDQSEVYNSVIEALERGECIGIFPEGGSHDRAEMLPLKAGVTIMALGTMARNSDLDVTIVPCGLNYFNPDKFRSRAIVEYGEPLKIDRKLAELFQAGGDSRREACGRLLDEIYYSLCSVTINVPDYETLQLVQATRRLYQPTSRKLSTFELLEVTRRFVKGYLAFKDQPKVKKLLDAILEYNKILAHFRLCDHQVRTFQLSRFEAAWRFASQLCLLLVYGVTLLPAIVLNLPVILLIDFLSKRKARKAVATSAVKIKGRDVLATWKLMVGFVLFPSLYLLYCAPIAWRMYFEGYGIPKIAFVVIMLAGAILPFLSYVMTKIAEHGYETYLSVRPLWYSVTRPHYGEVIRNLRHQLKLEIIRTVDEYGPRLLSDFERSRIVPSRRPSMPQDSLTSIVNQPTSADLHSPAPGGPKPVFLVQEESDDASSSLFEGMSDEIEKAVERAKSISRESSPVLGFEGMDSVMTGFQYMRAGVRAAFATSSSLLGTSQPENYPQTPPVDDWSYVEPVEIDDIFFTRATASGKRSNVNDTPEGKREKAE